MCEFDLPAYHWWLHQDAGARRNDLRGWIEPFAPIRAGSAIILKLLRDNGRASRHTAYRGVFQLMLTTTKVAQLLRLTLARDLRACPRSAPTSTRSTSASSASPGMDRGAVFDSDVEFELMFCNSVD